MKFAPKLYRYSQACRTAPDDHSFLWTLHKSSVGRALPLRNKAGCAHVNATSPICTFRSYAHTFCASTLPSRSRPDCGRHLRRFHQAPPGQQLTISQSVELLKAHDQRPPLIGVDAVGKPFHHDARCDMDPLDADLKRTQPPWHGLSSPMPCCAAKTASIRSGIHVPEAGATISEALGVSPAVSNFRLHGDSPCPICLSAPDLNRSGKPGD